MIKRAIFLGILVTIIFASPTNADPITGDTILTGEATSSISSLSINVLAAPALNLISPENITYTTNTILLDWEESSADNLWYNLNGTNVTITTSINLNLTEGDYVLALYANNSYGTTSKVAAFTSNLTANETSTAEVSTSTSSSGSGGGSEGGGVSFKSFDLDRDIISLTIGQGEVKKEGISIKNSQNRDLEIELASSGMDDILKIIGDEKFILKPGEERKILIEFRVPIDKLPNLYLGRITAKSRNVEKRILISVEVESRKRFLRPLVKILNKEKEVYPGKNLEAEISFKESRLKEKVDAHIEYIIKNSEGKDIMYREDFIKIDEETNLKKSFKIPPNLKTGNYILYVKTSYEGEVSSSSEWFYIEESSKLSMLLVGIVIILILLIILLIVLIRKKIRKTKKLKRRKK